MSRYVIKINIKILFNQVFFYYFQMRSINIYDFFPIENDEMMEKFLNKDRDYEERKQQFSTILQNALVDNKTKLANSIIAEVFDISYIQTHRWPTIK